MAVTTTAAGRGRSLVEFLRAAFIGCIAAAAIAAAVISSGSRKDTGTNPLSEGFSKTIPSSYEATPPQTLLYLVDFQEKADRIAISEHEWLLSFLDNNVTPPSRTYSIVVANTPEAVEQVRQLATLANQELSQAGLPFEFIDLHGK